MPAIGGGCLRQRCFTLRCRQQKQDVDTTRAPTEGDGATAQRVQRFAGGALHARLSDADYVERVVARRDSVAVLAHALQRLGDAFGRVRERAHGAERGEQQAQDVRNNERAAVSCRP